MVGVCGLHAPRDRLLAVCGHRILLCAVQPSTEHKTMNDKSIETVGNGPVFDSIRAWIGDDDRVYVKVEGMGNIRTVFFRLDEMKELNDGSLLDPLVAKKMKDAEKELKSIEEQLRIHKIKLGKELKSLEAKKEKVDRYCEKKKEEAKELIAKSADIHTRKFIKSCSDFSKSLIDFMEKKG